MVSEAFDVLMGVQAYACSAKSEKGSPPLSLVKAFLRGCRGRGLVFRIGGSVVPGAVRIPSGTVSSASDFQTEGEGQAW